MNVQQRLSLSVTIAVLLPQAVRAQGIPDVMNALGVPYSPAVEHVLQESDRRQIYEKDLPVQPTIPFWRQLNQTPSLLDEPKTDEAKAPVRRMSIFDDPYSDGSVGEIDESGLGAQDPDVKKDLGVKPDRPLALKKSEPFAKWPAQEASLSSPAAAEATEPAKRLPTVRIGGFVAAENKSPTAVIDRSGKQVIPPALYLQVSPFSNRLASVLVAPLEVTPPEFTKNQAVLDLRDKPRGDGLRDEPSSSSTQLKPRFGYMDTTGNWVIEPRFDMAGDFKLVRNSAKAPLYARAKWENADGEAKWGYLDSHGEVVIDNRFDWAGDFSEGLAIISLPLTLSPATPQNAQHSSDVDPGAPHQYGFIDTRGDIVITPQYDEAEPFSDGLAKVWSAQVSNAQLAGLSLDAASVKPNLNAHGWPQYRFITPSGETALEPQYDWISGFKNGFARVGFLGDARDKATRSLTPAQVGYINKQGTLAIPIAFENAWPFVPVAGQNTAQNPKAPIQKTSRQLLALVKQNGRYGYIGPGGNFAFPDRFEWADEFHENLAAVRVNGKYGFIAPNGKIQIKPQFDWVDGFSQGLAAIAKQTPEGLRYGFIDKTGKTVIPTRYAWVTPFTDGVAQVRK